MQVLLLLSLIFTLTLTKSLLATGQGVHLLMEHLDLNHLRVDLGKRILLSQEFNNLLSVIVDHCNPLGGNPVINLHLEHRARVGSVLFPSDGVLKLLHSFQNICGILLKLLVDVDSLHLLQYKIDVDELVGHLLEGPAGILSALIILDLIFVMTEKKHPLATGKTGRGKDQSRELMTSSLLDLSDYPHMELFNETVFPWQSLPRIPAYLDKLINSVPLSHRNRGTSIGSVHIDSNVLIGSGTVLEHGAMVKGPAIIGENCQLRKGAYIRGNVLIGNNCTIGNSSEIKHSIIFDEAQISHFNYVGDSIVGKKAHMAAGAITSNLKLDSTPVTVALNSENSIKTELNKFGAVLGQNCQIGCNSVLNPGSIIGKQSIVYPCVSFRGYLPPYRICKLQQGQAVLPRL